MPAVSGVRRVVWFAADLVLLPLLAVGCLAIVAMGSIRRSACTAALLAVASIGCAPLPVVEAPAWFNYVAPQDYRRPYWDAKLPDWAYSAHWCRDGHSRQHHEDWAALVGGKFSLVCG